MQRLGFLVGLGGLSAAASIGPLTPSAAYARDPALLALSAEEGTSLRAVVYRIVPHRQATLAAATDATVRAIDAKLASDGAKRAQMRAGLMDIESRARRHGTAVSFHALAPSDQVAVLTSVQNTPFFQGLVGTVLDDFYNRADVWRVLGYPGASMNEGGRYLGGYLRKGYDRLGW